MNLLLLSRVGFFQPSGGTTLDGTLSGALAPMQGAIVGTVLSSANDGTLAGTLGAMQGALVGGTLTNATVSGALAPMQGLLLGETGAPAVSGTLAGQLSAMQGSLVGGTRTNATLSGGLAPMQGAIAGLVLGGAPIEGVIAGALAPIQGLLRDEPERPIVGGGFIAQTSRDEFERWLVSQEIVRARLRGRMGAMRGTVVVEAAAPLPPADAVVEATLARITGAAMVAVDWSGVIADDEELIAMGVL